LFAKHVASALLPIILQLRKAHKNGVVFSMLSQRLTQLEIFGIGNLLSTENIMLAVAVHQIIGM
jgi:hypothetical protein